MMKGLLHRAATHYIHSSSSLGCLGFIRAISSSALLLCLCLYAPQWFQIAKNPPKIRSLDVISRIFPSFSKFTWFPVSGHWTHLILKICQTLEWQVCNQSISRILFFGGFLLFGPTVRSILHMLCYCAVAVCLLQAAVSGNSIHDIST